MIKMIIFMAWISSGLFTALIGRVSNKLHALPAKVD